MDGMVPPWGATHPQKGRSNCYILLRGQSRKNYVKETSYDFIDRVDRAIKLIRTKGRLEIARAGGWDMFNRKRTSAWDEEVLVMDGRDSGRAMWRLRMLQNCHPRTAWGWGDDPVGGSTCCMSMVTWVQILRIRVKKKKKHTVKWRDGSMVYCASWGWESDSQRPQ